MPRPVVATAARDPLRVYQFRVKLDQYVAGVRNVSGLSASVGAYEVWEGGNNLHRYAQPDKVTWDPITLEQGIALDDSLERWAQAVIDFSLTGLPPAAQPVKRNLQIELWDPLLADAAPQEEPTPREEDDAGRVRVYEVFNAWISRYQALPQLDATSSEVAIVSVEIMHEGWRLRPQPQPGA